MVTKNHRDVFLATEAGFVEYAGLPEKIKTGYSRTPGLGSKYCALHKETATTCAEEKSNQVALITSKQTTRNQIHYQGIKSRLQLISCNWC